MVFIARQEPFHCEQCGALVQNLDRGSYRNHCPVCLYSRHVDRDGPGDRLSQCQGLMKPIGIDTESSKGFVLIHECVSCGKISRNKAAPDDDLTAFVPDIPKD